MRCVHCAELEARYHELVKELVAMKRDGFEPRGPQAEVAKVVELDAVIRRAIGEVADRGSLTARRLEGLAWDMLRDGAAPEVVAERILKGEEVPL